MKLGTGGDSLNPLHYQINLVPSPAAAVAELERHGFLARRDIARIPFAIPFEWNPATTDSNLRYLLHAWRMIDPYLCAILVDPSGPEYLDRAEDVVKDWVASNILREGGPYTWYDMAVGIRASKIAFLQKCAERFGVEIFLFDGAADMISEHFRHLMNPEELNEGNHGLFQMWGLKSLASAFPGHPCSKIASVYAIETMIRILSNQFNGGVHGEHSPDYHFFAVSRVKGILNCPDWHIVEMQPVKALLEQALIARRWLLDTDARIVAVGDSAHVSIENTDYQPLEDWPHRSRGNIRAANLNGYGVVRTHQNIDADNASFLFMMASFHNLVHKQSDCLSVIWSEGGQDILVDSGKYAYRQDDYRRYVKSGHAHNTVEVNERTVPLSRRAPYGDGITRFIVNDDNSWVIEAEVPAGEQQYRHRRKVTFRPGHSLIVDDIVDPVIARRINSFTTWWHFATDLKIEAERGVVFSASGDEVLGVNFKCNFPSPRSHIHMGEKEPRLQGWLSPTYGEIVPAPVLGYTAEGKGSFRATTSFTLVRPRS